MPILFSSKPSSHLLLLRKNPNPNPRLLRPLSISFPLKPSVTRPSLAVSFPVKPSGSATTRPSLAVSASLLSPPPPPPPFLSNIARTIAALISSASTFFLSLIHSATSVLQACTTPDSLSKVMIRIALIMLLYLEIYVLMLVVRCYYPELPWHQEPLMTIGGICDPFLNFNRKILPPFFGSSDLSARLGIEVIIILDLVMILLVQMCTLKIELDLAGRLAGMKL